MPAEVISTRIVPSFGFEVITIMDDFGTELLLQIPLNVGDARQTRIDAAITQQTAGETRIRDYAAAHNIDLTDLLAAGALLKGNK